MLRETVAGVTVVRILYGGFLMFWGALVLGAGIARLVH
jgi:hypothetical protein